jgi:hypothetical protein
MYVDNFVYFLEDPDAEALFCCLLGKHCKVDFMGIVEWFLGIHFSWCITSSLVAIHLNQSGFATNLIKSFARQARDKTPTATPYCSGVLIDSIAPSINADASPVQIRRKDAYQSLIGCIGWLLSTTHPDLAAAHFFLSSYTNEPASGHMKAVLYVLHYIHSTHDYGISFTSNNVALMHSYIHYPPSSDAEAYKDAIPSAKLFANTLTAYSNACWGSKLGSSVADSTLLLLFKFCSMNGGIIFKNGGPIGLLGECQDQTSLSSREAKIRATNANLKKVVDFHNISRSVSDAGYTLPHINSPTVPCDAWQVLHPAQSFHHYPVKDTTSHGTTLLPLWWKGVSDQRIGLVSVV